MSQFLQEYKTNNFALSLNNSGIVSFDDLYQSYKNYINAKSMVEQNITLIVSKHFFEKYLTNHLSGYIKFDRFVSSQWFLIG
jgi:hypothetical protein